MFQLTIDVGNGHSLRWPFYGGSPAMQASRTPVQKIHHSQPGGILKIDALRMGLAAETPVDQQLQPDQQHQPIGDFRPGNRFGQPRPRRNASARSPASHRPRIARIWDEWGISIPTGPGRPAAPAARIRIPRRKQDRLTGMAATVRQIPLGSFAASGPAPRERLFQENIRRRNPKKE